MLFPLNTGAKLESSQTVGGALTLQVKNRSGGARSVYVRISNVSAPSGFNYNSLTASEGLQLDYTSDNSSNESNLITTALKITTTDQKLFTHAQHSSNSTYSFNYDAILLATNWKWYPGTYTITLLFTFVAP